MELTIFSSSGGGDTGVIGRSSGSSGSSFAALDRVTLPLPRFLVEVVVGFEVLDEAAALDRVVALCFSAFARRSPRRAGG